MQLKDVNAIVTGGASGLGLAVANRIVHGGGKAAIVDLSAAQGSAAARIWVSGQPLSQPT